MMKQLTSLMLSIPGLLLALSMHEFAHGYAAYKMGDNTAKYDGRLSLNPLDHMDPIGTLCLLFFHFGWAKPVRINPNNFRNQRAGIIVVSLAGPLMNFILALLSAIAVEIISISMSYSNIALFLYQVFLYSEVINIGLMVFNLIPIPPLDGSKVLLEFLPYRYRGYFYRMERYSFIILILLCYTGFLTPILSVMQSSIGSLISSIIGLIF